jgi:hypothetical protein
MELPLSSSDYMHLGANSQDANVNFFAKVKKRRILTIQKTYLSNPLSTALEFANIFSKKLSEKLLKIYYLLSVSLFFANIKNVNPLLNFFLSKHYTQARSQNTSCCAF